ncbi:hypothetical protein HDU97_005627 [Phlyctochytrium planicorne]|nr:hypothetical protein HDU97_005627 [Phlyctochytrium planicorne]
MDAPVTLTCLHLHSPATPNGQPATFPITLPISSPISHLRSLIAFHLNVAPTLVSLHAVQMFLLPSDPSVEVARKGGVDAVLGTIEMKDGDVKDIRVWGKGGVDVVVGTEEELPGYRTLGVGMGNAGGSADGRLFGEGGTLPKQFLYLPPDVNNNQPHQHQQLRLSNPPVAPLPAPTFIHSVNQTNQGYYDHINHAVQQDVERLPSTKEKKKKTKRWIMITVGIVILLAVLGAGVGLGIVLGKKKDGGSGSSQTQSPGPGQTGGATTTTSSSNSVPTSPVTPGAILKSYGLFEMVTTTTNPLSSDTFFASEQSSEKGFKEISIATGAVVNIFKGPHKTNVFGLSTNNKDTVLSADSTAIARWDLKGSLKESFVALPTGVATDRYTVRFMGGFTSQDVDGWSLVVLNDYYTTSTQRSGYVVIVPSSGSAISLPAISNNVSPWCGVILSSTSILIGTSDGLVTRYSSETGTWTASGSFRAHRQDTRWMALGSKSRLLYTAGFDGFVRAWNLDSLPLSGAGADLADPLATYSGFSGQVYHVSVNSDESMMVAGDSNGMVQAFSRSASAANGVAASTTPSWTQNVRFPVYQTLYLSGSNSWLVAGGTSNPVRLSN